MQNWVDLHSHILPNLDDGPDDLSESLQVLGGLEELGFGHVFATPHHRLYSWKGIQPARVEEGIMNLQIAARELDIDVVLLPGMEFDFDDALEEGDLPLPGGAGHMLVDIGFWGVPANLVSLMGRVVDTGIKVIMVHPERNRELCRKRGDLTDLVRKGVKLVGNLGSLSGMYGSRVQRDAHGLLKADYFWAMASDVHSGGQLMWIRQGIEEFISRAGRGVVEEMMGNRPMELVQAMGGVR